MKLVYTSQRTLPASLTGSELYMHELARAASLHNHVTIAATYRGEARTVGLVQDKSPQIHVLRFPERRLPVIVRGPVLVMMSKSDLFTSAYEVVCDATDGFAQALLWKFWSPQLFQFLLSSDFDLVHATAVPTGTFWTAWKAATVRGIPLVLTPFLHLELRQFRMRYITSILRGAQAVIAVTPMEARSLLSAGVPEENVHLIPLGIDVDFFSGGNRRDFRSKIGVEDECFVVLIPRKDRAKGILESLEAIYELAKEHHGLAVILLDNASPDLESRIRMEVGRLTRTGVKVVDLGYVPHDSQVLQDAYAAADLLLQPSSTEAFGLVYLEAWATATPVIAARCGAIPDVVNDGVNGLLVKFGSAKEIEGAIGRILSDRAFGRRLGLAGQEKLTRSHTSMAMWEATNRVYQSVLGNQ